MADDTQQPLLEGEIERFTKKQIRAVQTPTSLGWDPAESVAYEERYQRLAGFCRQLVG